MRALKPKIGSENEFSRFFRVSDLPSKGERFDFSAKPEECAALAIRLDLIELRKLEGWARVRVLPNRSPVEVSSGDSSGGRGRKRVKGGAAGDLIEVDGMLVAEFTQPCVLTLAPVAGEYSGAFHYFYTSHKGHAQSEASGDADPPEPLEDGGIDLGEAATQWLSLHLPDFPRAPGVTLENILSPASRYDP